MLAVENMAGTERCSDELAAECVMLVSFFWATVGWRFGCNRYRHPLDVIFRVLYVWDDVIDPSPCSDPPPTLMRCTHPLFDDTSCTRAARVPRPSPSSESPEQP